MSFAMSVRQHGTNRLQLDVKGKGKLIPITGPVWPRGWVEL